MLAHPHPFGLAPANGSGGRPSANPPALQLPLAHLTSHAHPPPFTHSHSYPLGSSPAL